MNNGLVFLEGSAAAEIRALVPEVLEARRFFIGRADPELFPAAWAFHGRGCPGKIVPRGWVALPVVRGLSGTYFILVALVEEGAALLIEEHSCIHIQHMTNGTGFCSSLSSTEDFIVSK
jgi:hypothetical protein